MWLRGTDLEELRGWGRESAAESVVGVVLPCVLQSMLCLCMPRSHARPASCLLKSPVVWRVLHTSHKLIGILWCKKMKKVGGGGRSDFSTTLQQTDKSSEPFFSPRAAFSFVVQLAARRGHCLTGQEPTGWGRMTE